MKFDRYRVRLHAANEMELTPHEFDVSHIVVVREACFAAVPINLHTAPIRSDDSTVVRGAALPRHSFQKLERSGFCG
jgi:hypothetical protein